MAEEEKETKEEKKDKNIPPACRGCIRWERFGKNCWYFWESKKECSMFASSPEEL
jgi:hypothetical protein